MPRLRSLILLLAVLAVRLDAQWRIDGPDSHRELAAEPDRVMIEVGETELAGLALRLGLEPDRVKPYALPGWAEVAMPGALAERRRLLDLPGVSFVTPVFADDLGGPLFPTRRIIAVLREDSALASVAALLADGARGRILERDWQHLDGALLIEPASRDGGEVLALASEIAALDGLHFAEPDLCFTGQKLHMPNDSRFAEQWGSHQGLQLLFAWSDFDIDAPEAWDLTRGNPAIKVAVLDEGVQLDHPDMPWGLPGADVTSEGPGTGAPVNGFDNHGTSVASVIIGRMDNGLGIAGTAPETALCSVRCYISTDPINFVTMSSWTVAALTYCEAEGVRITNNSVVLGAQPSATTLKYDSTAANGMIHYAAAGNSPSLGTRYPANLNSVRGLIGLSFDGQKASFSASGPDMDYTAPAEQVLTCDRSGAAGYGPADYIYQQGTSFATAYATAIGALVLGVNPALTDQDVHAILVAGATDLGAVGFDSTFANGLLNAYGAVWRAALTRSDPENVLWLQKGQQVDSRQAAAVALVGDVDGDGRADFAAGAPEHNGAAGADAGRVSLYSGATGLVLWTAEGAAGGDRFGAALAGVGDLNLDGIPDLAVGAPAAAVMGMSAAGRVSLLSGADGTILYSVDGPAQGALYGAAIVGLDDLDGDGRGDFAVGSPGATVGATAGVGRVEVLSGLAGALLAFEDGLETSGEREFGFALARCSDKDADLLPDLLIGAPGSLYGGLDSGAVVGLASLSGNRFMTLPGTTPADRLGHAVAVWGDQTGDGVEDYVAGAPGFAGVAGQDGGVAVVFSGATMTPTLAYFGKNAGDRQGEALCSSMDVDGDSVPDLAIGAPGFDEGTRLDVGKVEVWSTASFRVRYELVGGVAGQRFGAALAPLGDIDLDGRGEFLVGAPGDGVAVTGWSAVFPAANPAAQGPLPMAIAAGNLGGGGSGPYDTFYVNESSGGVDRVVTAAIGEDLRYAMLPPFANPNPANFALFAYLGVPPNYLNYTLPFGIGDVLWIPCTATPGNPIGLLITNSTGLDPCPQLVASTPAPWRYTHTGGLPFPLTVTFYGIVEETPITLAVTNALILKIQ